jgi:hypothetical protein
VEVSQSILANLTLGDLLRSIYLLRITCDAVRLYDFPVSMYYSCSLTQVSTGHVLVSGDHPPASSHMKGQGTLLCQVFICFVVLAMSFQLVSSIDYGAHTLQATITATSTTTPF